MICEKCGNEMTYPQLHCNWTCSECGHEVYEEDDTPICPYCGGKENEFTGLETDTGDDIYTCDLCGGQFTEMESDETPAPQDPDD